MVARVCTRVGVMYAGEMVERAEIQQLFEEPQHPYTQGLIRCVPKLGPTRQTACCIPFGARPPPNNRPVGCMYTPAATMRGIAALMSGRS